MTHDAIMLLFKEARDAFPLFKGKPTDDNLLSIREMLLPILMEIPYNQLRGVHSLMAILTDLLRYAANYGGTTFRRPARLPLYYKNIADNATTVVRVCTESAHCARLGNYTSYEAAKRGAAKFLHEVVNKVWYNDLKDADTFYTKVLALKIMAFLNANSGGLHAIDMITHRTNMHGYYAQADGRGGMANVVYCSSNDLCKNNNYYALSTPSSCNPTHLPSAHTGIANSGASGFYFCPALPLQISTQRLPPLESEWQTASLRGLSLAQPLLLYHLFHLQQCSAM